MFNGKLIIFFNQLTLSFPYSLAMAFCRNISDACSSNTRYVKREEHPMTPLGFPLLSSTQKRRYFKLAERGLEPTKFLDEAVLNTLGFKNDFDWFLPNLGWTTFMYTHEYTYARLTMEFLTSVKADKLEDLAEGEEGRMSFRLNSQGYNLTFSELNAIFGTPNSGFRQPPSLQRYNPLQWWQAITVPNSPPFSRHGNDVSYMPNPVLRYLHRVIAESFLSNGGHGEIAEANELLFMATAIYSFKMNTGAYLADHFVKVAKGVRGCDGPITIGGRITTIARHLGVRFGGLIPVPGKTRIDLQCCVESGMVEEDNGAYFMPALPHINQPRLRLPNPSRTTICEDRNWRCPGQQHPRRP